MAFAFIKWAALLLVLLPGWSLETKAGGLLDGQVFVGMIGPAENPDLSDSLSFNDGHFWSDICTQCGFVPGEYKAEQTEEGIAFVGTLESTSRGRFDYEGIVDHTGFISVSITWERQRWYWTSRRDISFVGQLSSGSSASSLQSIQNRIALSDPDGNPTCARF